MSPKAEPVPGVTSFDLDHYLEDKSLIAKSHRAGVRRYVVLEDLPGELRRLALFGVIPHREARELLEDLAAEGHFTERDIRGYP